MSNTASLVTHEPSSSRWTASALSRLAVWALREEATLTPKPGLVDRRGNGAHADMDLSLLLRSAQSLAPTFERAARCGASLPLGIALRERLGIIGRHGEAAMMAATNGINTHRGAIWSLGLLCAGYAGFENSDDIDAADICHRAGEIARISSAAESPPSHGLLVRARHGVRGARGEAERGFPSVHNVALPALRTARAQGADESVSRLHALLTLIACVDDTCILYRGGREALHAAQNGAREILAAGIESSIGWTMLSDFDRRMIAMNVSPGGSADLLAATLFVDRLVSSKERRDGNA